MLEIDHAAVSIFGLQQIEGPNIEKGSAEMQIVLAGPPVGLPDRNPPHDNLSRAAVANFAAHHMMIIM
jgi:hypothetical protein